MDKKGVGGEVVMFGPFFALLLIIFAGIYIGVNAYFSHTYEIRASESKVLAYRVEECFYKHDFFASDFNLTADCGLSESVLSENHLIRLNNSQQVFSLGVVDYANQCFLVGAREHSAYPKCISRELSKGGVSYSLLVGSNQNAFRGAA